MALSANKSRRTRNEHNKRLLEITGADSQEFYEGAMCVFTSGASTISVASDSSGVRFAGVCPDRITTGASNTIKIPLEWGHSEWFPLAGSGLAAGDEGKNVVLTDDAQITEWEDETHSVMVGKLEELETIEGVSGGWVTVGVYASGEGAQYQAGSYTATLTDVTNVAASVFVAAFYQRIGHIVTVFFAVTVDATTTAATELGISLPIASDLAAASLVGHANSGETVGEPAIISADATNNRAALTYTAVGTGVVAWRGSFSYIVI
jgi:hypothetical protein